MASRWGRPGPSPPPQDRGGTSRSAQAARPAAAFFLRCCVRALSSAVWETESCSERQLTGDGIVRARIRPVIYSLISFIQAACRSPSLGPCELALGVWGCEGDEGEGFLFCLAWRALYRLSHAPSPLFLLAIFRVDTAFFPEAGLDRDPPNLRYSGSWDQGRASTRRFF
jgi:hypothetical protein